MEKGLTEQEAIKQLDEEYFKRYKEIRQKYGVDSRRGRDSGDYQEQRELEREFNKRYMDIKKKYDKHSE